MSIIGLADIGRKNTRKGNFTVVHDGGNVRGWCTNNAVAGDIFELSRSGTGARPIHVAAWREG